MATWDDILYKAKDLTMAAGKKACDYAELAKLKLKIADNNKLKEETLAALGKLLYDSCHEEEELDNEVVAELVSQVDELLAANEKLQATIDNTRGCKTCACGAVNEESAAYCNKCGHAL